MFEYGDELIMESYRIPWLILIQILAMFLLLILFYLHFSTAVDSQSVNGLSYVNRSSITSISTNNRHKLKARESETKETGTSISGAVQTRQKPDARQRIETSTANEGSGLMFQHSHHPCHFFVLAKQAFLKCLGIDSTPKKHHEKDD